MPHFDIVAAVTAAIGVLGLTSLCLLLSGRLGTGSIVGFLLAGVVIGELREIPVETVLFLREFAEIGVILLLFLIGLEIEPPQLRTLGRDAACLGVPQICISAAIIGVYAWAMLANQRAAIVLGLGFALSSTVVVMQLLKDRNEFDTRWARKAFAILIAQDLAIVPCLLLVSLMAENGGRASGSLGLWPVLRALVAVAAIVLVGRLVLTRVLDYANRQRNEAAFVCITFLGVLSAALGASYAGLSMALGTFLLGVTLSVSPLGQQIEHAVVPAKSSLLALFCLSVGLSVDLQVVMANWPGLLLNSTLILTVKFGVIFMLGLVLGVSFADTLRLSLTLAQCGEFGFVLFANAQQGGLLTPQQSALASVVITISMVVTPFLVNLGARLARSRSLVGEPEAARD